MICEKEDRTEEYEHIITSDLNTKYRYFDYNNKSMSMYDFLKFKGINKQDANEILLCIEDRCHEMFIESEKYSESLFPISEDDNHDNSHHDYETSSDSDDDINDDTNNINNEVKQK
jgi:hypothetical protein